MSTPAARSFKKAITTPCWKLTNEGRARLPSCATTTTIYWPVTADDGSDAFSDVRLGYVGLTAHEFGHHLQATTGIVNAYAGLRADAKGALRHASTLATGTAGPMLRGRLPRRTPKTRSGSTRAGPLTSSSSRHASTGDEDPPADRKPDQGRARPSSTGSSAVWPAPTSVAATPGRPAPSWSSRGKLTFAEPVEARKSRRSAAQPRDFTRKLCALPGIYFPGKAHNSQVYLGNLRRQRRMIRLIASARVAASEAAAYGTGNGLRAGLADPAHRHTQVLALEHDDHPAWLEKPLKASATWVVSRSCTCGRFA